MLFDQLLLKIDTIGFFTSLLVISANLLLIISGMIHHREKNEIKYPVLFIIIGSFTLLRIIIYPRLDYIINTAPNLSPEMRDVLRWVEFYIVPTSLGITFGIFFIILGLKNKRTYGYYLVSSGIIKVIAYLLYYIFATLYYSYLFLDVPPPKEEAIEIAKIFYFFADILLILSHALLLIYAIEYIEKYLGISALMSLLANSMSFILFYYYINLS